VREDGQAVVAVLPRRDGGGDGRAGAVPEAEQVDVLDVGVLLDQEDG
jgi:hypothetical protein